MEGKKSEREREREIKTRGDMNDFGKVRVFFVAIGLRESKNTLNSISFSLSLTHTHTYTHSLKIHFFQLTSPVRFCPPKKKNIRKNKKKRK